MNGHDYGVVAVLLLAFGNGLVHALDADHVMAVSGLATSRPGLRYSLRFCVRWAAGHGLTLIAVGAVVYGLGLAVPKALSGMAEGAVGVLLVAIGCWVLATIRRRGMHAHYHTHDGTPPHAHWHDHKRGTAESHLHEHGALIVGMVHGIAGSAPLLVLIPLAEVGNVVVALGYLVLFSLGVAASMLVFGGALGTFLSVLSRSGERAVDAVRVIVATASIAYGGFLVMRWL